MRGALCMRFFVAKALYPRVCLESSPIDKQGTLTNLTPGWHLFQEMGAPAQQGTHNLDELLFDGPVSSPPVRANPPGSADMHADSELAKVRFMLQELLAAGTL